MWYIFKDLFKKNLRGMIPIGIGMIFFVGMVVLIMTLSILIGQLFALIWIPLGVFVGIIFGCITTFLAAVVITTIFDASEKRR